MGDHVTERPVRHRQHDAWHIKVLVSADYYVYGQDTTRTYKLSRHLDKAVVVPAKPCAVKVASTV
jgi:hypothetical protein